MLEYRRIIIGVLKWLVIVVVVSCKIKEINELEARESKNTFV